MCFFPSLYFMFFFIHLLFNVFFMHFISPREAYEKMAEKNAKPIACCILKASTLAVFFFKCMKSEEKHQKQKKHCRAFCISLLTLG